MKLMNHKMSSSSKFYVWLRSLDLRVIWKKKILYSRSHRLRFDNFVLPLKHFNKAQTILCFKNPRKTLFRFLHFQYPRNCHAYFIRQPLFFFLFISRTSLKLMKQITGGYTTMKSEIKCVHVICITLKVKILMFTNHT